MKTFHACFLMLLLYSCSEEENVVKPTFSSSEVFTVPSVFTFKWFDSYTSGEHTYCIYFTTARNQFIGFDLNKKASEIKFSMPQILSQNEDIGSLRGFYVYNFDSIFLLHDYRISIVDTAQNVKFSKIINNPESDELPDTIYGNFGGNFPLTFRSASNTIFCMQYSGSSGINESQFFKLPIEASLCLSDSQFKALPINYPSIYAAGFYGEATDVFRLVNNNLHIYSFNADPNLYTLDIASGKKMTYNCKSVFDKVPIKKLNDNAKEDMNKKMDHLINSPLYLNVLYDKYRDCYYRFFYKPLELKNNDGTYNNLENKELSVIVLDKDFNKVKEYDIGSNYLWYYSVVAKNGLYLFKKQIDNDSKAMFTTFKFDLLRVD